MPESNYPTGRVEAERRLAQLVTDTLVAAGVPIKGSDVVNGDLHLVLPLPEYRGEVS